ncbi:Fructose-bisphosphate aldolase 1 [Modicella reniformis]|uniref:Fructose-bisphosphate aldolase n=1 Tax=Modicella reniformis TaxID=1440133 RepID=A0A9P6IQ39_9FUNG|nr:Fructose-bisphosphate aldolase 1 [Modicella reniformis]
MGLLDIVQAGVITGDNVRKVFAYASEHKFAIPAINCTSSSTVNAALEAARDSKAPIIIQFSNGGAAYFAGKGISNKDEKASILGAIAGAHHVRAVAKAYGVPVILHSDHCAKKLLPWFDGMLAADEEYFAKHGEPLFSSHMLDLSEESKEENIETCPQDILDIHNAFSKVTDLFSIAAAFGNVHGVYAPGNVKLHPELLGKHQAYLKEHLKVETNKPVWFVFHGGSGSSREEIQTAVNFGVVKMNVDTDTQWAYWKGIKEFYEKKRDYLQAQVGNPEGPNKPNKKVYDPRVWVREGEKTMVERVKEACADLGNVDRL